METRRSYRVASNAGSYIVDGRASEVSAESGERKRIRLKQTDFEVFYQIVEREGAVILRHEFQPWNRQEGFADRRHPVDMAIVEIRRELGESIVETERGRGYRLSPKFSVELIPSPSSSDLVQLLEIALSQVNRHTSHGFRAGISNCEGLIKEGKILDACTATALAYINLGHIGFCLEPWSASIQKAREVLSLAINRFPANGSAFALRGLTYLVHDYDWEAAENDFLEAFKHSAENMYGHLYVAHMLVGRRFFTQALRHARRAGQLSPNNPVHVITEAWFMLFAEDPRALTEAQTVAERFKDSAPAQVIFGHCCRAAGDNDRALKLYDRALAMDFLADCVAGKGFVYGQLKRRKEADQCLELLYQKQRSGVIVYVSGWHEALVYVGIGERKMALDALERAVEEKCAWLIQADVEPRWKSLRGEKRFQKMVQHVVRGKNATTLARILELPVRETRSL